MSTAKNSIHSAEEQHTAMDKIGGFVYQFYCFLYLILTMSKGEEVSFEKLDDAAVETESDIILCQTKHTIQISVGGEIKPLTDRSFDLWKAIDVWRKLIEGRTEDKRTTKDMLEYIECHKFVFCSNKSSNTNKFVQLCENVKNGSGKEDIDKVLDEITNEGKSSGSQTQAFFSVPKSHGEKVAAGRRTTQMMIDDLKKFELRNAFLKKISFETKTQDVIEKACIDYITDSVRFSKDDAKEVFKDFLIEVVIDFFKKADKGLPLSYTHEEQLKRFERVFQYHREEKLDFRFESKPFKKDFLDLICIKQLIRVSDFEEKDIIKVAKCASLFYSFRNRYEQLKEDSKILDTEDKSFREDAITFWENEFNYAYDGLNESATDDDIVKEAKGLLRNVRQCELKLCNQPLGIAISNGAWYYLSDECIIGWHRDWEKIFNKADSTDGQDYQ